MLPLFPFLQTKKCGHLSCLTVIQQLQARASIQTRAPWLPSPCLWPVCDTASIKRFHADHSNYAWCPIALTENEVCSTTWLSDETNFLYLTMDHPLHSGNAKRSQMHRSYSYSCHVHRDTELSKWVSRCHTTHPRKHAHTKSSPGVRIWLGV